MGTKTYSAAVVFGLVALLGTQNAFSSNPQQVIANIRFDTPLTVTKNADIDFKSVTAGVAQTVYRISTASAVSVVSGPGTAVFGTPVAGNLTISGSTTQGITIAAGNAAAGSGGATVGTFRGNYNGGGSTTFPISGAAPGAGKTLLIGCDLTTAGSEAAGSTDNPTFDITVTYQ